MKNESRRLPDASNSLQYLTVPHQSRYHCDMGMPVRIHWSGPDLTDGDYLQLKACFDAKWISQGPVVEAFEKEVASLSGCQYCVAVSSGASALIVALASLDVSAGDEVIIPAMSFIAVPYAVTLLGATPALADIEPETGMLTTDSVKARFSGKTKAVVGIDYAGFTRDWSDIHTLCKARNVSLLVDAASSFLASIDAKPSGSWGDASIFSFHTAKTITTGEGGAVVTNSQPLAQNARAVRNYGEIEGKKYRYGCLGGNFRMTDVAASLGISQLRHRAEKLKHRREIIRHYLRSGVIRDHALKYHRSSQHMPSGFTFTILCQSRDAVARELQDRGIETRIMWPLCVDEQPVYQKHPVVCSLPIDEARMFSRRCLSLPVHAAIGPDDLDYVVSILEPLLEHGG